MSERVKIVYRATRNPAIAAEDFPRRWRRHGRLAMSLGMWRHTTNYYHCDALEEFDPTSDPYTGSLWSPREDGVGCVSFIDREQYGEFGRHPDYWKMRMDEAAAFDAPIAQTALLCDEVVYIDRPGTAVRLFQFLPAAERLPNADFVSAWTQHAAEMMSEGDEIDRVLYYSHNHILVPDAAQIDANSPRASMLDGAKSFTGVSELGFATRADLQRYLASPHRSAVLTELARFADVGMARMVATRSVLMDPGQRPHAS